MKPIKKRTAKKEIKPEDAINSAKDMAIKALDALIVLLIIMPVNFFRKHFKK